MGKFQRQKCGIIVSTSKSGRLLGIACYESAKPPSSFLELGFVLLQQSLNSLWLLCIYTDTKKIVSIYELNLLLWETILLAGSLG